MERLTYRLIEEDQCGNPTDSIILKSDLIPLKSSEKLKIVLSCLAAIEDILGEEYDLERLKLLLDNDKSCYTCRNYKGEKKCGFKGLDVEINPQEGCSVREAALRREQNGNNK